ncbi:MmpS family membrane protein [Micromonospora kangleipakensis]|uniref:MmpS family membrane protein n=1 Tax=Micromonospora kangleipakensis TaxID=1077942 RepID=A0A4Q8BJ86_9ACTN|nr:MmpS family transport accessory protein [Micromonospora kangleipakensis]RZU78170.1 MmpS family membrane protein [Micromonospora kangleipakensis]
MSQATPPPDPQPATGAVPTGPTAAPHRWVPPDKPSSGPEPDPWLPPSTGAAPAAPGSPAPVAEPAVERPRGRDGRTTTVVLSVFAVVVLAVCGLLGVAGLLVNLPADPFGAPKVAGPRQDTPTTPDEDEDQGAEAAAGGQPAPDPTPTRKPAATPSGGPGRFAVAYEVTGQGPANIQYYDADGYLVELDEVRLPWHTKISTDDPSRASVMANKGDDKGGRTIACAMTVNGGVPVTESVDDRGWRVSCGG